MDYLDPSTLAATLQTLVAAWGLKVLGALAIVLIGRFVAGSLRALAARGFKGAQVDDTLVPFLANLIYAGVLTFVILAALQVLGVPTSSAIAVIGAAGLAVALAFQGTLSNFSAGVLLLTFRPFKVGDFVETAGVSGTVKEIGVFFSILHTPDNIRVVMPNSKISGEVIRNFTANDTRRIDLVMGVGYDDDLEVAIRVMGEVLEADERVLAEPEPTVAVHELGASSVDFVVRPWVRTEDYWATRWALTRALKERLEAAGCNIPYPQRDVHLFHENAPPTAEVAAEATAD
jgi:small conductance mechanosensitive channel